MIIRRAASHLFRIFKVYVSVAFIGAFTMMAFAMIYAEPVDWGVAFCCVGNSDSRILPSQEDSVSCRSWRRST